jgi:hypothetical protein
MVFLVGHRGGWHPLHSLYPLIRPRFVLNVAASSHYRLESVLLVFTMMAILVISGAKEDFYALIVHETSRIVAVPGWSFSSVAAHL